MWLAAILAFVVACGDGAKATPDAAIDAEIDAAIDAPPDAPPALTFTAFVIDLVQNQTADTTDPVPYATFSGLPDPDLDNPAAYMPLFP